MNDSELDDLLDAWKAPPVPASLRDAVRPKLMASAPTPRRSYRRWLLAAAVAMGALSVGASLVQDAHLGGETGYWGNGVYVSRMRIVHPGLARLKWGFRGGLSTGMQWKNGSLVGSVYLYSPITHTHYGYSWNARPVDAKRFLLSIEPLDPSVLKEDGAINPLPHPPPPTIVAAGSKLDVDLASSDGQRVYDHIEFSDKPAALLPATALPNFSIVLTHPQLFVNGQSEGDSAGVAQATGQTVRVDVPGRGEFVLTLDPHGDSRFAPDGVVDGTRIRFHFGDSEFVIECSDPVAAKDGLPVYVYFRPDASIQRVRFSSGGPVKAGQEQ